MKSYPVAFYTFFGYIFKTESRVFGGVNKDKENARRKIRRAPFLYTTNSAVSHAYFFYPIRLQLHSTVWITFRPPALGSTYIRLYR